jgi:hypothetical protein
MCVEPRNGSLTAIAASQLKVSAHLFGNPPLIPTPILRLPRLDPTILAAPSEHTLRPASFSFLIPFRSPPLQSSYRA